MPRNNLTTACLKTIIAESGHYSDLSGANTMHHDTDDECDPVMTIGGLSLDDYLDAIGDDDEPHGLLLDLDEDEADEAMELCSMTPDELDLSTHSDMRAMRHAQLQGL